MKVKLLLERATFEMKLKGEFYRKVVEVEIPDTDNSEAEKKGVWQIMGYIEGGRMTKEELKQEVEDWWNNTFKVFYLTHNQLDKMCSDLLEPREKQIQIDAEQIRALMRDVQNLKHRLRE